MKPPPITLIEIPLTLIELPPEKALCFAMLERAILDIFQNNTSTDTKFREHNYQISKSAYKWLMLDTLKKPQLSAQECCDHLQIDIQKLRKLIEKRRGQPKRSDKKVSCRRGNKTDILIILD